MDAASGPSAGQECVFRVADGNDAGQRGEALLQIRVKLLRLLIRVTSEDGIEAEEQDILRVRSEEHTSELQSRLHIVCRLLLEKKKYIHALIELYQQDPYLTFCYRI